VTFLSSVITTEAIFYKWFFAVVYQMIRQYIHNLWKTSYIKSGEKKQEWCSALRMATIGYVQSPSFVVQYSSPFVDHSYVIKYRNCSAVFRLSISRSCSIPVIFVVEISSDRDRLQVKQKQVSEEIRHDDKSLDRCCPLVDNTNFGWGV